MLTHDEGRHLEILANGSGIADDDGLGTQAFLARFGRGVIAACNKSLHTFRSTRYDNGNG